MEYVLQTILVSAVVSEYFFERPKLLKEKHPGLYESLTKIFYPSQEGKPA